MIILGTYLDKSTWGSILNFKLNNCVVSTCSLTDEHTCTMVGWKVHRLTMIQWLNLTKCGLFFKIHVSSAVHTYSSIGVAEKVLKMTSSSIPILIPSQVFFHLGKQIRSIWRVINQLKATVMHSSHCNHRLVCRSIVLDSLRQFSRPFWNVSSTTIQSPELLIQCGFIWKGNNAVCIRKGWIWCIPSFIHVACTTLS